MAAPEHDNEAGRGAAIRHYLETGETDPLHADWPGSVIARGQAAHRSLLEAVVAEVQQRSAGLPPPVALPNVDLRGLVERKVEPMVRGLFPVPEREVVLDLLTASVVFLTPDNVGAVIRDCQWLNTGWDLANLYLASVGAELLGEEAPRIVGLGEHTRCYVSLGYFTCEDRFADFVVHESAHIFHNCKRRTAGLPNKGNCEWLLDIQFTKRETFAYACEAYSRIFELASSPSERTVLLAELADSPPPNDHRVDEDEYLDILTEAVRPKRLETDSGLVHASPVTLPHTAAVR